MSRSLEEMAAELESLYKQKHALEQKEKVINSEEKRMTRSERTHRLCTRGAMLESHLIDPDLLEDEDVDELLTFIFRDETVTTKLNGLLDKRREFFQNGSADDRNSYRESPGLV